MEEKTYIVNCEIKTKEKITKLKTKVKSKNEKLAKEKAMANIGSRHKINRHQIKITSIEEAK
jgi:ribosomal protein L20A (L18A)